jgi:ectoine hydroxylase-related dioxygenase (phytanoyl-CoA dioxygenase family)
MCIVPRSQIEIHAPDHAARITNAGACRYTPVDDHTEVHDDDTGEVFTIPVNLETIKITPKLAPGDLLMLRGDTIHRTQDNLTRRVALSMRCTNGNHVVNKTKILNGCEYKKTIIQYNKDMYATILERFGEQEEITINNMFNEHGKQL